jgi:predicted metal-dependent hydrolase
VTAQTAPQVAEAGANLMVAGSAVNRHPQGRRIAIDEIRAEAQRGWRRGIKLRQTGESGVTTENDLGAAGGDGLERGVELFNRGEFWEAHEAWEGAWMPHRHTPEGDFYKGLVQVAAGFYHYNRRNKNGALIKWRDGAAYLRPFAPEHEGIVVSPIIETIEGLRSRLESNGDWPALEAPRLEMSGR